jgi:hypothetical protein
MTNRNLQNIALFQNQSPQQRFNNLSFQSYKGRGLQPTTVVLRGNKISPLQVQLGKKTARRGSPDNGGQIVRSIHTPDSRQAAGVQVNTVRAFLATPSGNAEQQRPGVNMYAAAVLNQSDYQAKDHGFFAKRKNLKTQGTSYRPRMTD